MVCGYLACSFDLLNVADLDVIDQARQKCDRLIVGVYSDSYAERVNGRSPVVPAAERLELVSHVRGVDGTRLHDEQEPGDRLGFDVVFAVVGSTLPDVEGGAILIAPGRTTSSLTLQQALACVESGVA